jgi:hypothetical protein
VASSVALSGVLASGIEHWSTVQAQLAPRQVPSVELASVPVRQRLLLRQKPHSGAAAHASQPESAAHGSGVVASRTALSIVLLASGAALVSGVAVTSRDTVTSGVLASGVVGGLQATAPNSAPAIHGVRRERRGALGWRVEVVMKIDGPFAQGVVFAPREDRGVQRECHGGVRVKCCEFAGERGCRAVRSRVDGARAPRCALWCVGIVVSVVL